MLPIGLAPQLTGVSLGAVFALMIGGAGASPPEITMLSAIFKPRLWCSKPRLTLRTETKFDDVPRVVSI